METSWCITQTLYVQFRAWSNIFEYTCKTNDPRHFLLIASNCKNQPFWKCHSISSTMPRKTWVIGGMPCSATSTGIFHSNLKITAKAKIRFACREPSKINRYKQTDSLVEVFHPLALLSAVYPARLRIECVFSEQHAFILSLAVSRLIKTFSPRTFPSLVPLCSLPSPISLPFSSLLCPPTLMPSFVQFQLFDVSSKLTASHWLSLFVSLTLTHMCTLFLPTPSLLTSKASIHLCLPVPSSHIPRLSLKSSEP